MGPRSRLQVRRVSGLRRRLAAGLLAVSLVAASSMSTAGAQQASFVETFDEAWSIIAETHYDPDFGGLDWNAVRDELRPRASEAETVGELRAVINDMIGRLGLSHFALWPRGTLDGADEDPELRGGRGHPGFDTMMIGDRFVVSSVEPASPAEEAGVQTGWIVVRVGDVEIADRLKRMSEYVEDFKARVEAQRALVRLLSGRSGSEVEIAFLDAADAERVVSVGRRLPEGDLSGFGNLPRMLAVLDYEQLEPDVDIDVGLIRFNIWLPVLARQFDVAINELRDADGVVLDLRGNPGGVGGMVMGIGGHFVDDKISLGTMRMRDSELQFMTNPRRVDAAGEPVEPYAGPLAILMDNTSASTSEVFAGGMQAIGRARVFGQRSTGAVLPSLMDTLPNGDVLQHAVADFIVTSTGERLEGRGVIPDVEVEVTRADLLEGRDPTLEAALEWIARQR